MTYETLGTAKTIGELKAMIESYPDGTSFGFRNQPTQELLLIKQDETNTVFVVFQQRDNPFLLKVDLRWLKMILETVLEMRKSQKHYFNAKNKIALDRAKAREAEVDKMLNSAQKAGYMEIPKQNTTVQTTLFKS